MGILIMNPLYKERLLKLAQHLETGDLGHNHFYFGDYNQNGTVTNPCGTQGCAIGECPIVFPDDWEFLEDDGEFLPVLEGYWTPRVSGMDFFGLDRKEYDGLFIPYCDLPWDVGLHLASTATQWEVAQNIRRFVEWKEWKEENV
jgi:hypothetical protein